MEKNELSRLYLHPSIICDFTHEVQLPFFKGNTIFMKLPCYHPVKSIWMFYSKQNKRIIYFNINISFNKVNLYDTEWRMACIWLKAFLTMKHDIKILHCMPLVHFYGPKEIQKNRLAFITCEHLTLFQTLKLAFSVHACHVTSFSKW